MKSPVGKKQISVIVPVGGRFSDVAALYADYQAGVVALDLPYEFIYVLDGTYKKTAAALDGLRASGEPIIAVSLTRRFGEATALMVGFEQASGEIIVTLPAYSQIEGGDVGKLVAALEDSDMAIGHRTPRAGNWVERLRRTAFHGLLAWVTPVRFHDLGCGARAFKRRVLEEIHLYGEQHRFLAVLADRQGFRVREIAVRQSPEDRFEGVYGPRDYTRNFLDIITVFFLVRFTKRPLRFFGMIGALTFLLGAALVVWLVIERLFFGQALADRPALLLSSLLVVLGLQLFALGLLGELVIFTHAREIKDYQVERVIQFADRPVRFQSGSPDDNRSAAG